jgi:pimeloyl-ACP methyl ester carboxylesterase
MVRGIIMLGPFTRDPDASGAAMLFLRVLLGGFWGVSVWRYYYKSLHVTKKPQDLDEHVRELAANLKQKGRHDVLLKLLFASKAECARRIPEVKAPVLVIMGDKDPDFSKPEEEVKWIENAFTSTSVTSLLVEGAGHYPHVEFPSQVYASSKAFIKSLSRSH